MTEEHVRQNEKTKRKSNASAPPAKRRPETEGSANNEGSDSTESAPDVVDPSTWTLEFRQLEQVFRSLNTVYTFCCTRKHFPTTFENLKSSVENLTGRFDHHI